MSVQTLKARVMQLEAKDGPICKLPAIRIIQHGELTQEQQGILAEAKETGRLVIVRQIVSPTRAH
jgi:hypothetical protein